MILQVVIRRLGRASGGAEDRVYDATSVVRSANPAEPTLVGLSDSLSNTGDKLRSSIACAGFVCFIPLLGDTAILTDHVALRPDSRAAVECSREHQARNDGLQAQGRRHHATPARHLAQT